MSVRTTFNVISFYGGGCLQLEQTLLTLPSLSIVVVSRNSRKNAGSFNRSGSETVVGVGFSKDSKYVLLPQVRVPLSESEKPETAVMV